MPKSHSLIVLATLIVSVTACGEQARRPSPEDTEISAPAAPRSAPAQPVSEVMFPFVGVWAARPELCEAGAWTFTPNRLSTAGEVTCDFRGVAEGAGRWMADVSCVAQGPAEHGTLTLSYAEASQMLTVSGGPFAGPVNLIRCG